MNCELAVLFVKYLDLTALISVRFHSFYSTSSLYLPEIHQSWVLSRDFWSNFFEAPLAPLPHCPPCSHFTSWKREENKSSGDVRSRGRSSPVAQLSSQQEKSRNPVRAIHLSHSRSHSRSHPHTCTSTHARMQFMSRSQLNYFGAFCKS